MRRGLCLILCALLPASTTACVSGMTRAEQHRARISVGMTQDEVRAELGRPDERTTDPARGELWLYWYQPGDAGTVVVGVLLCMTIVGAIPFLIWVSTSHGSFTVRFGTDGRVAEISPVSRETRIQIR